MASNSTMTPAWAVYGQKHDGWLVDTSFVWSWDVAECAEFSTTDEAHQAIVDMQENYGVSIVDYAVIRIR